MTRDTTLGDRLAEARRAAGLSQQAVADRVVAPSPDGSHRRQTIYEWEKGLRQPSVRELASLCTVYGVSADALLELAGPRGCEVPSPSATAGGHHSTLGRNGAAEQAAYHRVLGILTALAARPEIREKGPDPLHAAVGAFRSALYAEQRWECKEAWDSLLRALTAVEAFDERRVPSWADVEP